MYHQVPWDWGFLGVMKVSQNETTQHCDYAKGHWTMSFEMVNG